jgi:DNA-binding transcriptional regulator PaaX
MGAKTGWQPHSVRAALTGLRKRGLAITREKNDAGVTVYRLAEAGK